MENHVIIKKPIISEKSMQLVELGKYTFQVDKNANKIQIKNAIQDIFDVHVLKVNVINLKPKAKRVGQHAGFKPAVTKAIISLAAGDTIELFNT